MAVNVKGPFLMSRAVLAEFGMRRGAIVNIGVSAWTRGDEGSRGVLRVKRRSNDADEGHGRRSWTRKHSRQLHLPSIVETNW